MLVVLADRAATAFPAFCRLCGQMPLPPFFVPQRASVVRAARFAFWLTDLQINFSARTAYPGTPPTT
jgi:hypothetical protein